MGWLPARCSSGPDHLPNGFVQNHQVGVQSRIGDSTDLPLFQLGCVQMIHLNQVVSLRQHPIISLRNRPNRCYCYYARAGIYIGALQDPLHSGNLDPYKLDMAKTT